MVKHKCPTDDEQGNDAVQHEGACEVDAQSLAVAVVIAAELEISGYDGSLGLQRLGDDADVGDAGLLDGIHDRGEGAKRNSLIGSQVDDALGGICSSRDLQQ